MSVLLFLAVLFVLVLVHEYGHFLAARKTGMRVDEFGIGFPPRLFARRRGETLYTFNAIPLGGFVKIFGEDREDADADSHSARAFSKRPLWAQALVLVAGVSANILLAYVLFAAALMIGTVSSVTEADAGPDAELVALAVMPESPAAKAGLEQGEQILSISSFDDEPAKLTPSGIAELVRTEGGARIRFVDEGEEVTRDIKALAGVVPEDPTRPVIGVTTGLLERNALAPLPALKEAAVRTVDGLISITTGIASLLYDAVRFEADLTGVAGPVGIAGLVGDAASFGIATLFTFTAFISLNLAVINLLPFPALDGGRLIFVIVEAIKGSPVPMRISHYANAIGFIILMLLMAAVTYNDIARLVS